MVQGLEKQGGTKKGTFFTFYGISKKTSVLEMQGIGSIHLEIDVYFGTIF